MLFVQTPSRMWQTPTQQGKRSWGLFVFLFTLSVLHHLMFSDLFLVFTAVTVWCLFLFSILRWVATPHFTVLLSLSARQSISDVLSTFLTHFTLAYLLFIWLCHWFCHLSALPQTLVLFPADSAAGFWGCTILCVRWEQVMPRADLTVSLSLQLTSILFEMPPPSSRLLSSL